MLTREELLAMNQELQEKVAKEIENIKIINSESNTRHLEVALYELKRAVDFEYVPYIYPRILIDCWDYTDSLGNELGKFSYEYKKYLKKLERQERKKNKQSK